MKVCCLPSIPAPEQFKVRQFLDLNGCEIVSKGKSDLRIWCDNMPRKNVKRRDTDINGRMIDASKSWLEACVRKAFGYGYAVDPRQHHVPMVEKYNWHARHPKVVQGPVKPDRRHFYSELLTGIEWRIAVMDMEFQLVCTYTKRELDENGLGKPIRVDASSRYDVSWADVMSRTERIKFFELVRLLGLDYGEFDVIRHADGRFCPIDINPSPSPPSPHSFTPEDFARIIPHEAELFREAFL